MVKKISDGVVINAPLSVILPRVTKPDKKAIVNMNNYRNWHYVVSNQIKKAYKAAVRPQLIGLRFDEPIYLSFKLFKKDKRRGDRANVLSIHEKFFCDALTECGCIEDDNDLFILNTNYSTGGVDRENPRVEITITTDWVSPYPDLEKKNNDK